MHLRKCFVFFDGEIFIWTLIISMLEKCDNKTLRTFKPHRLNALRGIQLDFSPLEIKSVFFISQRWFFYDYTVCRN